MDWEKIGYMLGNAGALSYFQNAYERRLDKGREKLKGINSINDDDTQNARGLFNRQFSESPYLGQNPEMMQLQLSKDYMQAQNDAQYLLNNGYDENSEEVQGFRQKMADAHSKAENLRKVASGAGFGDVGQVSAGLSLQELKDKINHVVAPGLYSPQQFDVGKALADKHAWAGQTAQSILSGQQGGQNAQPGQFQFGGSQGVQGLQGLLQGSQPNALQGVSPDAQYTRKFTEADLYKVLQDEGYMPKDVSYEDQINTLAQQIAKQRVAQMNRDDMEKYLRGQGVGRHEAQVIVAEYQKEAQAQMRKAALAQAAASSTSPQMAELIAAAAADPNAKWSDFVGLITATNPEMKLNTIDTGGLISAIYGDERGRVPMTQTTLQKTLSPDQIATHQYNNIKLQYEAQRDNANRAMQGRIADARNQTDIYTAKLRGQNALEVADRNGQYSLARTALGKSGKDGEDGDNKMTSAMTNAFDKLYTLADKKGDVTREEMGEVADEINQSISSGIQSGDIKSKDAYYMTCMNNFAQIVYAAKFGEKGVVRDLLDNYETRDWFDNNLKGAAAARWEQIKEWLDQPDELEESHARNILGAPSASWTPMGYDADSAFSQAIGR